MTEAIMLNEWWLAQFAPVKSDRPPASTRISLTAAAQRLGVTREHLSRVLHGHRESRSLLARFQSLEKEVAK